MLTELIGSKGLGVRSTSMFGRGRGNRRSRRRSGASGRSSGSSGWGIAGALGGAVGGAAVLNHFSGAGYSEDMGIKARRLSAEIGLDPEIVYAIVMTESGGNPCAIAFNGDNFMTHLSDADKETARAEGFTETEQAFTGGDISTRSGSGYTAYDKARDIDPEAAIRALAMGRYQVLGNNIYDDYGSASAIESAFTSNCDSFSDDVFVLWWSGKGSLIRSANSGDIGELVTRYYGVSDASYEENIRGYMQSYIDNNQDS